MGNNRDLRTENAEHILGVCMVALGPGLVAEGIYEAAAVVALVK